MNRVFIVVMLIFSTISYSKEYENIKNKMVEFEKKYEVELQGTTQSMSEAFTLLYKEWDKNLNYIYKKLIFELEKIKYFNAKNALIESQREWIKYRDSEATFIYYADSGDGVGTIRLFAPQASLSRRTEKRTLELAEIYDNLISDKINEVEYTNFSKSLFEKEDEKLNEKYKELLYILEELEYEKTYEHIVLMQRAWNKFKDKESIFHEYLKTKDGKIDKKREPYYESMTRITKEKIEFFEEYIKFLSGI